jgi:poly-gamma-glutamate capsule biosynthesis protein CapA/YwtB (metallophosphatase superfamily)
MRADANWAASASTAIARGSIVSRARPRESGRGQPCCSADLAQRLSRRGFLAAAASSMIAASDRADPSPEPRARGAASAGAVTLFLAGDVMTGRGIDQILPHPNEPHIYEPFLRSAIDYVKYAEQKAGRIPRPADFSYIWGFALEEWTRARPDVRIVNLETAVTSSADATPGKSIHYRMHPDNAPALAAAGLDCCVLANNHVLDWGRSGLIETLETLRKLGIQTAGAGRDDAEAAAPAILEVPGNGRVLVLSWGLASSGIPQGWAAGKDRPGVNLLPDLSSHSVEIVARSVLAAKRPGDIVVASLHWGGNWGFLVSNAERAFAHQVIEQAGVDIVHGHSSHHVKGLEVYRDRPIIYGAGDFLNDYEGISGNEEYRGDLALMFFPTLDPATGRLENFVMTPTQTRRMRVNRASEAGTRWLLDTLNREGEPLGTSVAADADGTLRLGWSGRPE